MAIPLVYNMRSAMQRWASSLVAVLGIAGTVAVFVAMLALARGFKATLVSSGLPQNAIVQQAGADSEMTSAIELDAVRVVEDAPQVARRGTEPLVSAEVVVIAALPLRGSDSDANVQMRGVSQRVLAVRDNVRDHAGPVPHGPGCTRSSSARTPRARTRASTSGRRCASGRAPGRVVGIFDAGGSAFDSEIWADADVLNGNYQRPPGVFQSVTRGCDPPTTFRRSRRCSSATRARSVQAVREAEYYEAQSRMVTTLDHGAWRPGRRRDGAGRGARRAQHDVLGGCGALARDRGAARARVRRRQHRAWRSWSSRCGSR